MAFTGSICDREVARRASEGVYQGALLSLLVDGNLTSLATAQAAVLTAEATKSVCDRNFGIHVNRALQIGVNFGASATGSSLATFYGALPANNSHAQRMIS